MRFPIFGIGSAAAPDWRGAMTAKRNPLCDRQMLPVCNFCRIFAAKTINHG